MAKGLSWVQRDDVQFRKLYAKQYWNLASEEKANVI